jgi:hypothetical protein
MTTQQSQQADNSLNSAVLKSQEGITATAQDVLTGAQEYLEQAQAAGNEDSIKNAKAELAKAQEQLTQAQSTLANTTQQTQGEANG